MDNINMDNTIPKIIFIIPYRNRENEKTHFSIYIKYLMEDYNISDYEIYYSHQTDSRPFNRGATKNIGFLVMKNKYPNDYKNITFVFNDIDTIPYKKNILNYATIKGTVKHFYGFKFALGGIFSINGADFESCNGFPNNWGWGLEDNEMQRRVLNKNIKIDRTQFYPLASKEILHIYDHPNRLVNNRNPGDYLQNKLYDNLNQIKNLKYDIEPSIENNNDLQNNEFVISINNFNTLINPANELFYTQNLFYNGAKLIDNKHGKVQANKRWSMHHVFKH